MMSTSTQRCDAFHLSEGPDEQCAWVVHVQRRPGVKLVVCFDSRILLRLGAAAIWNCGIGRGAGQRRPDLPGASRRHRNTEAALRGRTSVPLRCTIVTVIIVRRACVLPAACTRSCLSADAAYEASAAAPRSARPESVAAHSLTRAAVIADRRTGSDIALRLFRRRALGGTGLLGRALLRGHAGGGAAQVHVQRVAVAALQQQRARHVHAEAGHLWGDGARVRRSVRALRVTQRSSMRTGVPAWQSSRAEKSVCVVLRMHSSQVWRTNPTNFLAGELS